MNFLKKPTIIEWEKDKIRFSVSPRYLPKGITLNDTAYLQYSCKKFYLDEMH